jgi:cystathionine beta-lyase/cystathionine gamma-synthase
VERGASLTSDAPERAPDRPLAAATLAVHAGEGQPVPRRPAAVPIYQTAPFVFASGQELGEAFASNELGGLYSRFANPTVRAVEEKLAALEGAEDAVAFASGMAAASSTLATLLRSGDRLLASSEIYGGTSSWLGWLAAHHPEVAVERAPIAELVARVDDAATAPAVVFVESPSNPLARCCDLAALAAACRRRAATLVVDGTFATPILQRPLELGAAVVVHSATKFLAGHDDVVAGLVAGDAATMARVRQTMLLGGACLDPHAAFLVGRGMKTLAVRVERASENAARLAQFLARHPAVERVHYPADDPVARRQMLLPGPMLACDLAGGAEAVRRLLDALRLVRIVPSLGGVDTAAMAPALTSHRALAPAERRVLGIGDGLLRLSVGIEAADDLERDLGAALDAAAAR